MTKEEQFWSMAYCAALPRKDALYRDKDEAAENAAVIADASLKQFQKRFTKGVPL